VECPQPDVLASLPQPRLGGLPPRPLGKNRFNRTTAVPPSSFNDIAVGISACITGIGVLVGGGWAFWRFALGRERYPKIQFNLDLRVVSHGHDHLVVEVVAIVENKGLVRHWLHGFEFDLLYLPNGAPIVVGNFVNGKDVINSQVRFEPIIKEMSWIPKDWNSTFIDAKVEQRYTYIAQAPKNASMLLVRARFKYPDKASALHTAQKVISVSQSSA
jgi:hypothetical protein